VKSVVQCKFSIGTAQIGLNYGIANANGKMHFDEANALLGLARQKNVRLIDTAVEYGDSQKTLGKIGVNDFKLVTKVPALPQNTPDVSLWVQEIIDQSLQELNITKFYGVLLHHPCDLEGPDAERLYEALNLLKLSGLTEKIGISAYENPQIDTLIDRFEFDMVQAPLSIIDRRIIDSGCLERMRAKGIEFHARSIFLQGLLTLAKHERPPQFSKWQLMFESWDNWLVENQLTSVEACIRYITNIDGVDRVVLGIDSCNQLIELIAIDTKPLQNIPVWPCLDDMALLNPRSWNNL
jgi:aryl-alcohol dehydrogenase-like predicted oxidoreductase